MTLRCPGCDQFLPMQDLKEGSDGVWRCGPCTKIFNKATHQQEVIP